MIDFIWVILKCLKKVNVKIYNVEEIIEVKVCR